MSRADDFDGKNAAAHISIKLNFSEHITIPIRCSMTRGIE
jgi:hypothetical protein